MSSSLKICSVCSIEKFLNDFYLRKESSDGYRNDCKECFNKRTKVYRKKHISQIKESRSLYYKKNKEKLLLKKQEYRRNNPEKYREETKKYYEKTKTIQNLKKKKWIIENREIYNQYYKTMKKNNPIYKVSCAVRSRINKFLKIKNIKKKNSTFDLIGCSPEFLKEYIEKQFTEGMTWENHGQFGWHIDHIIPLSSGTTDEEIRQLCHYKNLQPLWWNENLDKRIFLQKRK